MNEQIEIPAVAESSAAAPPYDVKTRAKGWRFEIDHELLEQSDTWALASADQRPWLLMLYLTAWRQMPCGTLPNNDNLIAVRLGLALPAFTAWRYVLMRGWSLASDGRLYHATITKMVLAMLAAKTKETERKRDYRDRQRKGGDVTALSHGTDAGQTRTGTGSDDTGTGTGTKTGERSALPTEGDANAVLYMAAAHAMATAGLEGAHSGDPRLRALVDAGANPDEFKAVALDALHGAKGASWAFAALAGRRRDLQGLPAPAVADQAAQWHQSKAGVILRGAELGLPWQEDGWVGGECMHFPAYTERVKQLDARKREESHHAP